MQEPDVAQKELLDVVDAVLHHREPFHTHAESEPAKLCRVVPYIRENCRIDHSAAHHFDPAALLADTAAFAAARAAGNIDFRAWLRKRKKTRAKASAHFRAEKGFQE